MDSKVWFTMSSLPLWEMKTLIEVDKFLREEILIPGAEAAKEVNEKMMTIVEEDEKNEEEKEDEKKEEEK